MCIRIAMSIKHIFLYRPISTNRTTESKSKEKERESGKKRHEIDTYTNKQHVKQKYVYFSIHFVFFENLFIYFLGFFYFFFLGKLLFDRLLCSVRWAIGLDIYLYLFIYYLYLHSLQRKFSVFFVMFFLFGYSFFWPKHYSLFMKPFILFFYHRIEHDLNRIAARWCWLAWPIIN